jgi:hypothetical protein
MEIVKNPVNIEVEVELADPSSCDCYKPAYPQCGCIPEAHG